MHQILSLTLVSIGLVITTLSTKNEVNIYYKYNSI